MKLFRMSNCAFEPLKHYFIQFQSYFCGKLTSNAVFSFGLLAFEYKSTEVPKLVYVTWYVFADDVPT